MKFRHNTIAGKIVALFLCVSLTAGLLTGCSSKSALYVAASSDVIQFFDDNGLTKYFDSAANVSIKWIDYGGGSDFTAQISDSSKTRPDAYLGLGLSATEAASLPADTFLDLGAYLDQTVNLKAVVAGHPELAASMEFNGQLLSFPTFYEDDTSEYPAKMWINTQWLKDAGLSMPATTDELLNVLTQLKADMNQNGLDDEVPMTAAYQGGYYNTLGFLISAFCATQFDLSANTSYLSVDGMGNVYTEVTSENFRAALRYIKELMDDGLLDKNIFTNTQQELLSGGMGAEKYGVIPAPDLYALWNDAARAAAYEPIPPLTSPVSGQTYSAPYPQSPETGGYLIAASSKRLDAALRFGDAMLSREGTLSILYGTDGWQPADPDGTTYDGSAAAWRTPDGKASTPPLQNIKAAVPYWYDVGVIRARQASGQDAASLQTAENWQQYLSSVTEQYYEPAGAPYENTVYPQLPFSQEDTAKLTQNGTDVRTDVQQYLLSSCQAFVTGEMDLDADWSTYVNTLHDKGLDAVISAAQSSLDAYRAANG